MESTDLKKISGDKDKRVVDIMDEIQRGLNRRKKEEKRWDHNESFEDLRQWNGELGKDDQVTINKLSSYIRNYRAQIAYNEPRVKLTPKTSDGWKPIMVPVAGAGGQPELDENGQVVVREVVPAKAREALINSIMSAPMQNAQQTSGLVVKAAVLGYGVLKTGYRPIFESDPKIEGEQRIPIRDGKLDLSGFERNRFNGSLIEDEDGRLIERKMVPIWEDFYVKWVPYRNMIIDPDGGNYWDDHRWVCEEEVRELEEVKKDPLFENTSDLSESGYTKDEKTDTDIPSGGSDWGVDRRDDDNRKCKIVRLFHYYDLVNRRYMVVADGHGKFLRDISWIELGIVDHPYADFRPNEIIGEFYPRPPASDLAPINEFYNIARRYELIAMQRSTRKVFTRKGTMDAAALEEFSSDEDMAVVDLDMPRHQPLSDAIMPFTPPPVSEAIYANTKRISDDFAEVGGQSDEARGKASADTATQVNAMEQYSGSRIEHDRKILAETWRRIFKKLNDAIDQHMTKERAIMVQGEDGVVFNALIDPLMIAGDFDVEIDFELMGKPNTAMQSAERARIAQIAGQAPHLFMDEALVRGWLEPSGIKDQNFIDALVKASQMQMQLLMMQAQPQANAPVPNADMPNNEAEAVAQAGAGSQVPRQSGSR